MSLISLSERAWYLVHRRADIPQALLAHLPHAAARVLDLGGGDGRISLALSRLLRADWTVADIDAEALARVPRDEHIATALLEAGGDLPFPDRAFDAVLVVDVLHHVRDQEHFLRQAIRCLRAGGALLLVEFDSRRRLIRFFGLLRRLAGERCRFWNPEELRSRLESLGLAVATGPLDSLRFLAVARRG
jgi:ubiquinone/menaquinone biosynthesis C-methylase UbiE